MKTHSTSNWWRSALSRTLPLLLGFGLIYYQWSHLTTEEWLQIKACFAAADYRYIYLSLVISLYGYWARAHRWSYVLQQMGYRSRWQTRFLSVSISYLVNLTLPRSGEITRAALIKKYEEVPFDKAFGTIIAERMVDLALFGGFVALGFAFQFDTLNQFLSDHEFSWGQILWILLGLLAIAMVGMAVWTYAEWSIIVKLKAKLKGLTEGMSSLLHLPQKWAYLGHSLGLWGSYFAMFYVTIFALPETADIPMGVVLMGFIFGSLAVGFTNGGLGAYPVAIALVFALFGISKSVGIAFGWLVWASQTLFTIAAGLISYLFLPLYKLPK